jgi:hypothetical protein
MERPARFAIASQSSSTVIPALSQDVTSLQSTSSSRELAAPKAASPDSRALLAVANVSGPRAANFPGERSCSSIAGAAPAITI